MSKTEYNELDYVCALDLETGGLNEQDDQVLEVHARFGRITSDGWRDSSLAFSRVLPLVDDVRLWHPVALEMHAKNGLLVEAMAARAGQNQAADFADSFHKCDEELVNLAVAFSQTFDVRNDKARITLLGNTVHFDLRFVRRVFPRFARMLSHRVIDVSTIRLFCQSLGMPKPDGEPAHRAKADVDESLRLLAEFRRYVETREVVSP